MLFNKKGEGSIFGTILISILMVLVAVVLIYGVVGNNIEGNPMGADFISALPGGVNIFYNIVGNVVKPILNVIYLAVAPQGEGENVKAIAVSIFLLLSIVGFKTLEPTFKSKSIALVVSLVIGVIAARSLTETILKDSALGASPLAAVSLLVGLVPVLALSKGIKGLELTNFSNFIIYLIVAFVYVIFFTYVFDASKLGAVYGAGILLLGVGQMILPYYSQTKKDKAKKNLGGYMASVRETVSTVAGMNEGDKEAKANSKMGFFSSLFNVNGR